MDELAYKLKMDPIQLAIGNYAETDPDTKLPGQQSFERKLQAGARINSDGHIGKADPRSDA